MSKFIKKLPKFAAAKILSSANLSMSHLPKRMYSVEEYKKFKPIAPFVDKPDRRYVFLGVGSIAKTSLNFLNKFVSIDYKNVTLIDQIDMTKEPSLQEAFAKGATFMKLSLKDDDWEPLLKKLKLKPLDMVIDLTTDTNGYKIIEAVKRMSLLYVNTALEINWHAERQDLYECSLLKRHHKVEEIAKNIKDPHNATHVYEFGMNPGLISHFSLQGLLDVAEKVLQAKDDKKLAEFVAQKNYAKIARHLELHTIHVSELDTQISKNLPDDGTFVNTWSVKGLLEEGCDPAQAGWGSHEKTVPSDGVLLEPQQIAFHTPAYQKYHASYVPHQEIRGVIIPHGEAITVNKILTIDDYSPTVHYVYQVCKQARALLDKHTLDELNAVTKWRVMNSREDDLEGEDRVGALLIFAKNPITGEAKPWTYWFGSIMGQGNSKFFGPTTIQVSMGVLAAIRYTLEHPNCGSMFPEGIPTDYVIKHVVPHLGRIVSEEMAWKPPSTQFSELALLAYKVS